jgi:hypothetical protein
MRFVIESASGEVTYIRDCFFFGDDHAESCQEREGDGFTKIDCTCRMDGCNAASAVLVSASLCSIIAVAVTKM